MSNSQGVATAFWTLHLLHFLSHMLTEPQVSASVLATADIESNMQCFTVGAMFLEGQVLSASLFCSCLTDDDDLIITAHSSYMLIH